MNPRYKNQLITAIYGLSNEFLEKNQIQRRHLYNTDVFNMLLSVYEDNLDNEKMEREEAFTEALRAVMPVIQNKAREEKEREPERLELLFSEEGKPGIDIENASLAAGSVIGFVMLIYGLFKKNRWVSIAGAGGSILFSMLYFIRKVYKRYREFIELKGFSD